MEEIQKCVRIQIFARVHIYRFQNDNPSGWLAMMIFKMIFKAGGLQ